MAKLSESALLTKEMLEFSAKGFLASSEVSKGFRKVMAISKIKRQPFFGKTENEIVRFRRPTPHPKITENET